MAGFREVLAVDFDRTAIASFRANFPEVPALLADVRELDRHSIRGAALPFDSLDVLDGSPPCQGFSSAGKRRVHDERNSLPAEYVRLVDQLRPRAFVMENVEGMVRGKMRGIFKEFVAAVEEVGYRWRARILDAQHHGVAQHRRRVIVVGFREDVEAELVWPEKEPRVVVRDVLPPPSKLRPQCSANRPGVELMAFMKQGDDVGRSDAPLEWRKKFAPTRLLGGGARRLNPDDVSTAVLATQYGTLDYPNELIHPHENRLLEVDEAKLICSFPADFILMGRNRNAKWRQIGNCVPPNLMRAIARSVRTALENGGAKRSAGRRRPRPSS
jgi:DNA (cytosine-5)-methyltransferase 1